MSGLNPAQEQAAREPREDLFVAAGAGSGKTRALAWRYANAVEGGGAQAADSAVAITFTDKAAGELAERIRRVLLERGNPAAARSVDAGWISTIHGFCSRIVRRHALELGIDPRYAIASEVEDGELRSSCFEAAARRLSAAEPAVAEMIAAYGVGDVREAALRALGQVRALAARPRDIGLDDAPDLATAIARAVDGFRRAQRDFAALDRQTPTACGNQDACREAAEVMESVDPADADTPRRLRVLAERFSVKRSGGEELKSVCEMGADVAQQLARAAAAAEVGPHQPAFIGLLEALDTEYAEAKRTRGLLDYDDLLLLVARLFDERPDVADAYAGRFEAVMVDEYQDTDPVQASIVERVASRGLCTVGDEQQAIYGFRFADVEVFRARAAKLDARHTVSLDTNYRSHPDILRFVNGAFGDERLLGDGFLELLAGREDDGPAWATGPRVRVVAIEKKGWDDCHTRDVETAVVTDAIVSRLDAGCRPADVAVLLSTMRHADCYVDALRTAGVPTYVESGASILDGPEARAVLAVARVIANAHDEQALLALLAGPLGSLSDDALMRLALARADAGSLWGAARDAAGLERADAARLGTLLSMLDDLRAVRGRLPLDEMIVAIVEATDLDLALASQGPEGERALACIFRMARLAGAYERASGGDVAGFIEHLALREEHSRREPSVASGAEGAKAVRLMTVHAAKGLEFPFVVLPEGGRAIPTSSKSILAARVEAKLRLGMAAPAIPELGLEKRQTTDAWEVVRAAMRGRDLAETRRVLYVACTRARDALFVSGVTSLAGDPKETTIDWFARTLPDRKQRTGIALETRTPDGGIPQPGSWCPPQSASEPRQRIASLGEGGDASSVRPSSVSYTALRDFAACSYRFHALRLAGLGSAESGRGPGPAAFGKAAHAALSLGGRLTPERLAALMRAHGVADSERGLLSEVVHALGTSADAARAEQMERAQSEVPFAVPVGATILVGNMDVLAVEGDQALVIDYKTGPTPSDLADAATGHTLQADCYALAAFAGGAARAEVVFVHADGGRIAFEYGADDEAALRARVEAAVAAMEEGPFLPLGAFDAALCPGCPAYRATCPVVGPSGASSAR